MVYIFGHIGGDAQTHLYSQYAADLANPFVLKKELFSVKTKAG